MHIKLLPSQIPMVWEHIKFGIAQIGEVPNEYMNTYCVHLLHRLLSGSYQCWVLLNADRVLLNISVTKITEDPFQGARELWIEGFYAFQGTTVTSMTELFSLYRAFAKKMGCARVAASSRVPRAKEILEQHGFVAQRQVYTLSVEVSP